MTNPFATNTKEELLQAIKEYNESNPLDQIPIAANPNEFVIKGKINWAEGAIQLDSYSLKTVEDKTEMYTMAMSNDGKPYLYDETRQGNTLIDFIKNNSNNLIFSYLNKNPTNTNSVLYVANSSPEYQLHIPGVVRGNYKPRRSISNYIDLTTLELSFKPITINGRDENEYVLKMNPNTKIKKIE